MREVRRPERGPKAADVAKAQVDFVDLTDHRPTRRMTLLRLFSIFVACLALKGGLIALMGPTAHATLSAQLGAGPLLARFLGLLLVADPFTRGFAEIWGGLPL